MYPAETQATLEPAKPLLLILDGHALVHRAWHAIREPLTVRPPGADEEEDIRAVYGFLNSFLKTLSDRRPTHIATTFDLSAPTFRHELSPEYKAHRPPTPPALRPQFGHVKAFMRAFGVPIYEQSGFEADDIIGTLCRQTEEEGIDTIVLTGDTDTFQLVSPTVSVLLSHTSGRRARILYDVKAVRERYGGLGPEAVADIKALVGDSSDNIAGVPGIGQKTAINLLNEYSTIQGIYDNLDEVRPPRAKKSLIENREVAFRSQFLTTIRRDADVALDMNACKFGDFSRTDVIELMRGLEFSSLIPRVPYMGAESAQSAFAIAADADADRPETDYEIVDTPAKLAELVDKLAASDGFSFDTETTSKDPMRARLVGLSFSTRPHQGWYVPVGHCEGEQIPLEEALAALRPVLTNPRIPKTAHNANYDMMALENHGVVVEGIAFDTMIAAHALGRNSLGLKNLAKDILGEEMTPITDLIGRGRNQVTMADVAIDKAAYYATADADMTERLRRKFQPEIERRHLSELMRDHELPLISVLVRMQRDGVAVDVQLLRQMSKELKTDLDRIRASMYETVGHEFNLNSSQQLGEVLFEELRLPSTKKTRSGNFSTDAASIENLKMQLDTGMLIDADARSYDILNGILEYRQLSKIRSTYVDALPELVNPETGRIHTKYNQTGSATGRLSSNDPNVQNIPVRTKLGRRVRRAFIAPNPTETTLLAADYSQIELRVLAYYSQDPTLLTAFERGEDIHSATSSLVYGVPLEQVTGDMRRIAKILNFGVLYGLTAFGISQQTDLTPEQGQRFIDIYFERYPRVRQYMDDTVEECRQRGYVSTLLGRRRYMPDISPQNRNFHRRQAAERAAINMPIQGTAAEIIRIAMLEIMDEMITRRLRSKMILQVHDELIFEVPHDELSEMKEMVKYRMEHTELMRASGMTDEHKKEVPMAVELKTGGNWGDLE